VTDDPNGLCAPPVADDTPGHDGKDHGKEQHRPDPRACAHHPRSM
jgi:hypothetical protein